MARQVDLAADVLGDPLPRRRDGVTARRPDTPTAPEPPPVEVSYRKFTMRFSDLDDELAHRVVNDVIRRARIRPTKQMRAEVIRALLALADTDPELRERVAARLHDTTPS